MGKTDSPLCPVSAVLAYMARHGPGEGPLFRFQSGLPLSRSRLVAALRDILGEAGYNPEEYAGHSFRIGCHHGSSMWHFSRDRQDSRPLEE